MSLGQGIVGSNLRCFETMALFHDFFHALFLPLEREILRNIEMMNDILDLLSTWMAGGLRHIVCEETCDN